MGTFVGNAQQDRLKRHAKVFKSSHCKFLINLAPKSVLQQTKRLEVAPRMKLACLLPWFAVQQIHFELAVSQHASAPLSKPLPAACFPPPWICHFCSRVGYAFGICFQSDFTSQLSDKLTFKLLHFSLWQFNFCLFGVIMSASLSSNIIELELQVLTLCALRNQCQSLFHFLLVHQFVHFLLKEEICFGATEQLARNFGCADLPLVAVDLEVLVLQRCCCCRCARLLTLPCLLSMLKQRLNCCLRAIFLRAVSLDHDESHNSSQWMSNAMFPSNFPFGTQLRFLWVVLCWLCLSWEHCEKKTFFWKSASLTWCMQMFLQGLLTLLSVSAPENWKIHFFGQHSDSETLHQLRWLLEFWHAIGHISDGQKIRSKDKPHDEELCNGQSVFKLAMMHSMDSIHFWMPQWQSTIMQKRGRLVKQHCLKLTCMTTKGLCETCQWPLFHHIARVHNISLVACWCKLTCPEGGSCFLRCTNPVICHL